MTHITLTFFSLYVHRGIAHKALIFHPVMEHFIRFWLWLTDGTQIKHWIAMHRKHHRYTDKAGDPHSPVDCPTVKDKLVYTWKNFYSSVIDRYKTSWSQEQLAIYGKGVPDDWINRHLYQAYPRCGLIILLSINLLIFGTWGFLAWIIQVLWTPTFITVVVTVCCHVWGYHNPAANDFSRNIFPIGIFMSGEELHSNHHADPANAKFSKQWWEFDLGWCYITLLKNLGLVTVVHRESK